jgi:hypothetical protein
VAVNHRARQPGMSAAAMVSASPLSSAAIDTANRGRVRLARDPVVAENGRITVAPGLSQADDLGAPILIAHRGRFTRVPDAESAVAHSARAPIAVPADASLLSAGLTPPVVARGVVRFHVHRVAWLPDRLRVRFHDRLIARCQDHVRARFQRRLMTRPQDRVIARLQDRLSARAQDHLIARWRDRLMARFQGRLTGPS